MNLRQERIERLLHELRYEIERGMMDGEIDETLGFRFLVPVSKSIPNGVVLCKFETRPIPGHMAYYTAGTDQPRLKVIKGEKK